MKKNNLIWKTTQGRIPIGCRKSQIYLTMLISDICSEEPKIIDPVCDMTGNRPYFDKPINTGNTDKIIVIIINKDKKVIFLLLKTLLYLTIDVIL